MNRAVVAWLALVLPIWLVLVLCTYWEPVMRDGWGHFAWHHQHGGVSLFDSVWEFAERMYLYSNPRLGQVVTMLQHTPGPWHPLVTPLVVLAMFYLLGTLVLGRWPSPRRTDDALLVATIIAMVFATVPSLGPMFFYRPYSGNYLVSFAINLAWLVPYRLHAESARPRRWWLVLPMLVLGVASGLCNEHTGPTFIAVGLVAVAVYWRRGERFVPWAWSGLAGMIAGASLLYLAPGQDVRYLGLATKQSTFERTVDRGVEGNAQIVGLLVLYLAPLLVWLVLGAVARARNAVPSQPRSRRSGQLVLLGMAFTIVATLLASPKHGDRLYFASICLACAAAAGWVVPKLGVRERRLAVGLAAFVIAFVSWRVVLTYHRLDREFAARMAVLEAAPVRATVKLAPYSQQRSRYVLGDDFRHEAVRAKVAYVLDLTAIELEPIGPTPPPDDD